MDKKEFTISDVARAAGVSVSTISRILNNKPDVAETTRTRVKQVIQDLGYEPHSQAQRLAAGQSRTIALLDPLNRAGPQSQEINQLHLDFMIGAATAAGDEDYFFYVVTNPTRENQLLNMYRSAQVDGIILMEIYLDDPRVNLLREKNLPFVMIGRCADNTGLSLVELDFEGAALRAFQHLTELGHSKIGFMGFPQAAREQGFGPAVRAWNGYQAALDGYGLEPYCRETHYTTAALTEATLSLLDEQPDLTAIVAMTDAPIVGVFNAARQKGLAIPAELSVVGLAIDRIAEFVTPNLTAIRFPSYEMGYQAAKMLIENLKDPRKSGQQVMIDLEMVIRESSGPIHAIAADALVSGDERPHEEKL